MYELHKVLAMICIFCGAQWSTDILIPLSLCFLGDIWFIYYPYNYDVAVVLFSAGHYLYSVYFIGNSIVISVMLTTIVLIVITQHIFRTLQLSWCSMIIYGLLLLTVIINIHVDGGWHIRLGYTLFGVSDAILLVRDFYWDFTNSHALVLITYFLAQYLLTTDHLLPS